MTPHMPPRGLSRILVVLSCLINVICGAQESEPKLVAFVAAVSEYPGNAALYEAVDNAEAFVKAIEPFGFEVETLYNFDKDEFEERYSRWRDANADSDVSFVYLCAHGGSNNGENYIIPSGADIAIASDMIDQCIGIRKLLEEAANASAKKDRFDIFVIDGSRKNPFLVRPVGFEEGSADPSAFYSLPYIPENTAVLHPTGAGELLQRSDVSVLVSSLNETVFQDGILLKKGLQAAKKKISSESRGRLNPNFAVELQGDLRFESSSGNPKISFVLPDSKEQRLAMFDSLRKTAQQSLEKSDLVSAIDALVLIYDTIPEKQESALKDLKSILTSSEIENPFEGKTLILSEKIEFTRLAASNDTGLDLKEARRILWNSGQWFPETRELAKEWARYDAEQGVTEAMTVLGKLLAKEKTPKADIEAAEWLETAVESEDTIGMIWLGQLHLDGRGVSQSLDKAEEYFEAARKKGEKRALTALGSVELNRQKALGQKKLQEMHESGNKDATLFDALNESGADFTLTVRHLRDAIRDQHYLLAVPLSQLILSPFAGTPNDYGEAIEILKLACNKGVDSSAMWYMSQLLNMPAIQNDESISEQIANLDREELIKASADLGYPPAIQYVQTHGLDFEGAAKPFCERQGLSYAFWKLKQREAYRALRQQTR